MNSSEFNLRLMVVITIISSQLFALWFCFACASVLSLWFRNTYFHSRFRKTLEFSSTLAIVWDKDYFRTHISLLKVFTEIFVKAQTMMFQLKLVFFWLNSRNYPIENNCCFWFVGENELAKLGEKMKDRCFRSLLLSCKCLGCTSVVHADWHLSCWSLFSISSASPIILVLWFSITFICFDPSKLILEPVEVTDRI